LALALALALALPLAAGLFGGCAKAPAATPAQTDPPAKTAAPAETPSQSEAPAQAKPPAINIVTLKGPTGMGMVHLMEQAANNLSGADYQFQLAAAPDEVAGKIVTGEADIAAAPINLAANLYNKTNGGVSIIAINTMGVLYILENGNSIRTLADLAGKTLGATGQAATPEYILNYLLDQNGIAGKVNIEYQNDHAELAALLASGFYDYAMLPEPNVTATLMKSENLRVALDLTEEWNKLENGAALVQGCVIVRNEYRDANPEAVELFLKEYAQSTAFTNEHVDEAAELIAKYEIMGAAAAAKKAIPNSNIVCLTGEEMKANAKAMIEMLYEANPQSVGGALPDDGFYN
ncbi:MAG: PhnD/SsuA/transferrin family substrate-binding protein, partial [Clostridiales bacterium]|nr:PhnD/SsuA/transferrin family substrate-binding protein [Clostridiales bacterium]